MPHLCVNLQSPVSESRCAVPSGVSAKLRVDPLRPLHWSSCQGHHHSFQPDSAAFRLQMDGMMRYFYHSISCNKIIFETKPLSVCMLAVYNLCSKGSDQMSFPMIIPYLYIFFTRLSCRVNRPHCVQPVLSPPLVLWDQMPARRSQ